MICVQFVCHDSDLRSATQGQGYMGKCEIFAIVLSSQHQNIKLCSYDVKLEL